MVRLRDTRLLGTLHCPHARGVKTRGSAGRCVWLALLSLASCTRDNPAFDLADEQTTSVPRPESESTAASLDDSESSTTGAYETSDGSGAHSTSGVDSSSDSGTTESVLLCRRLASQIVFQSEARPLASASSSVTETDPFVSYDGSRLYFQTTIETVRTLVVATRENGSAFGAAVPIDNGIGQPGADLGKLTFAGDERIAVVSADYDAADVRVLWLATRLEPTVSFAFPDDFERLTGLELTGSVHDPHLSKDGLRLYYAPTGATQDGQTLYVSSRASLEVPFSEGEAIQEVDMPGRTEADPTLSADERVLIFSAEDDEGVRGLWMATRPDLSTAFSAPRSLGRLGHSGELGHPHLGPDGCELWYVNADLGTPDIWQAVAG